MKNNVVMFLVLFLILFVGSTFADDLKVKVLPTPIGQPTTYVEFIWTKNSTIANTTDTFQFQLSYDTKQTETPFTYIEPTFLDFSVTRNRLATPLVEAPPTYPIHLNDDKTIYSTGPMELIFNETLSQWDEIRILCKISYQSILDPILSLPDQGGLIATIIYTTIDNTDTNAEPQSESQSRPLYIVPSPELNSSADFGWIDFTSNDDVPYASYFSIKIPNNTIAFSHLKILPIGSWSFEATDDPLYCWMDGQHVAYGNAPDQLNEFYFFFTAGRDYGDNWTLPYNDGNDFVLGCQNIGIVFDRERVDQYNGLFGWAVSFEIGFHPGSTNATTIIVTNHHPRPQGNDNTNNVSPKMALPHNDIINQYDHYRHVNEYGHELIGDDDQTTVNVTFSYTHSDNKQFQFLPQWWRTTLTLNQYKKAPKQHLTNQLSLLSNVFNFHKSEPLLSTFSYLYYLTATNKINYQWDRDLHSFSLHADFLPEDVKLVYGSYSIGCSKDAPGTHKDLRSYGYGKITLNHTATTKSSYHNKHNTVSIHTNPISPWFEAKTDDDKDITCGPMEGDGMFYVTLQFQHTQPFELYPDSDTDYLPYPFLWLDITETLTVNSTTTETRIAANYTRQNGNIIDPKPRKLINDATQFTTYATPYDPIPEDKKEKLPVDQITGIYLINNITFTEIKQNTTYMTLYIPGGEYYFGTNDTTVAYQQLMCFMNGNETDIIRIGGYMNYTTEMVLNYDFYVGNNYTMTCNDTFAPLYIIPTQSYIKMLKDESIKKDKHRQVMMMASAIPNGYGNGGISAATYIKFVDEIEPPVPLWKKIVLIAAVVAVLVMSLGGIAIICICCCRDTKEYNQQQDGDFTVDDGTTHKVHNYGSITTGSSSFE